MTEIQNNVCDIHVGGNDSQNVRLLLNKIMGWKMEDIIMEDESTGLINSIWVCRTRATDPRPSPVVVRACRQRSVWRSVMVNSMCYQRVVMERLHCLGLGPPVYGVFSNGIVYGYVKGRCLSFKEEVQEDERLESAALENLHGLHQLAMPVDEAAVNRPLLDTCVFYRVTQLLHKLPDSHVDPDVLQCLQQVKSMATGLIGRAQELLVGLYQRHPLVFCHQDPHPANTVYDEDKGVVRLIDWDTCGHCVAPLDVAQAVLGAWVVLASANDFQVSKVIEAVKRNAALYYQCQTNAVTARGDDKSAAAWECDVLRAAAAITCCYPVLAAAMAVEEGQGVADVLVTCVDRYTQLQRPLLHAAAAGADASDTVAERPTTEDSTRVEDITTDDTRLAY